MEKDDEIKGSEGSSLDFGSRIYDPRIARFLSPDPVGARYPYWSPYIFGANNPIRFIDEFGEGPIDRVKKARNMQKIPYKKEQDKEAYLRTEMSAAGLEFMDCSEFVCRVLHADGITPKVEHMTSGGLRDHFEKNNWTQSDAPQVGDIAVWEGHVGVVTSVDKDGKFKMAHARGKNKLSLENPSHIKAEQYKPGAKFHGFYRPETETPDGKVDDQGNPVVTQQPRPSGKQIVRAIFAPFIVTGQILDKLNKTGTKVVDTVKEKIPPSNNNSENKGKTRTAGDGKEVQY